MSLLPRKGGARRRNQLQRFSEQTLERSKAKYESTPVEEAFYDTAGHLVQEVQKQIGGALHDHARTYVYVEDELVGLVDQDYYQVGAHAWPAIRLPDAKSPIWLAGAVLVGGAGLLLLARRRAVGTAPAAASTALLLVFVCAGAGRQTAVYAWVHTDR